MVETAKFGISFSYQLNTAKYISLFELHFEMKIILRCHNIVKYSQGHSLLNRDLQIGVQVQDRVRVQVSNFNSVAFSEPSLLPVADQLKRRLSVRDWREM